MISLENNTIKLNDIVHEIGEFKVGFVTPRGLTFSRTEALEVCQSMNLDETAGIRCVAVAVAVGEPDIYEQLL